MSLAKVLVSAASFVGLTGLAASVIDKADIRAEAGCVNCEYVYYNSQWSWTCKEDPNPNMFGYRRCEITLLSNGNWDCTEKDPFSCSAESAELRTGSSSRSVSGRSSSISERSMSKLVVLFFASAVVIATVLYSSSKTAGDRGDSAAVASSTALVAAADPSATQPELIDVAPGPSTSWKPSATPAPERSLSDQPSTKIAGISDQARPMEPRNSDRVSDYLQSHIDSGSSVSDYAQLLRSEPPDPDWSPRIESLIDSSIAANSKGLAGMQVAPTKCSRTVCMVVATSNTGAGPPSKNGWSRMPLILMNQPWFSENFHDAANSMTNDGEGNIHLLFMVRK